MRSGRRRRVAGWRPRGPVQRQVLRAMGDGTQADAEARLPSRVARRSVPAGSQPGSRRARSAAPARSPTVRARPGRRRPDRAVRATGQPGRAPHRGRSHPRRKQRCNPVRRHRRQHARAGRPRCPKAAGRTPPAVTQGGPAPPMAVPRLRGVAPDRGTGAQPPHETHRRRLQAGAAFSAASARGETSRRDRRRPHRRFTSPPRPNGRTSPDDHGPTTPICGANRAIEQRSSRTSSADATWGQPGGSCHRLICHSTQAAPTISIRRWLALRDRSSGPTGPRFHGKRTKQLEGELGSE